MAQFDLFANQLLEEAKWFLEKAKACSDAKAEAAYLHAALLLSFCALEAHVNSIGEEFSIRPDLSAHEKGLMLEQEVKLEAGNFQVKPSLKIARLEDRIEFLFAKFSVKPLDRSSTWWGQLKVATDLRNQLTHAKSIPAISEATVRSATQAIIDTLDALYQAIYKRKFPLASLGLQSRLTS